MSLPQTMRRLFALVLLAAASTLVCRLPAAEPPQPPRRAEVERIVAAAPAGTAPASPRRPLTIVLLSDRKDHGQDEHDYPRWQARWALLLGGAEASDEKAANLHGPDLAAPAVNQGAPQVRVIRAEHWPSHDQWETANLVVAYCYLQWTAARLEEVAGFLDRGGGLVLIHSATWTRPKPSPDVAEIVGVGGFQRWRHGELTLRIVESDHPICRGLPAEIRWVDEPYWPPTPPIDPERTGVLAGSLEKTEPDRDTPTLQGQFWTFQRGTGRVFGCVPGHYTWTFDDPFFRLLLLRGMAWAASEDPYRFDNLVLRCAAVSTN